MRRVDLTGQKFGRLTVVSYAGVDKQQAYWGCICECGTAKKVRANSLRSGHTQSCGCWDRERSSNAAKTMNRTHGHCAKRGKSPTYSSWANMIRRCQNPKDSMWKHYGGATPPVTVCERWLVFTNFYKDMLKRPAGTTLGRFMDTGDYRNPNCAWMTMKEQKAEQQKKRESK